MTGDEGWRRLHPLSPLARGWSAVAVGWAVLAGNGVRDAAPGGPPGVALLMAVIALLAIGAGFASWRTTRYRITADDLVLESGIFTRRSRRVPLARLQGVEVVRPPLARLLGLAELRLEVAGGARTEAPLAFLAEQGAQDLRAELLARAAGLAGETPEAPERILVEVPPLALVGSLLLDPLAVITVVAAIGLLAAAAARGEPALVGVLVPPALAAVGRSTGSFVRWFGCTLALSPDGLRLRHGLVETRAQTVPPGRVQAVRLDEPLLWRPFGWVRVGVTVAGSAGDRDDAGGSGTLLPVAPRVLALDVLRLALPGVDPDRLAGQPPPRRARGRAPVRWRSFEAAVGETAFAARRGRWHRTLSVVPHERIQSVRVTQGLWQRWLRLATVHADTMPGPVAAAALHRDEAGAGAMAADLVARARSARGRDRAERWMAGPPATGPVAP